MSVVNDLISICGASNVQEQEMMKDHTTFRIGGPAAFFVTPETEEALAELIRYCAGSGRDYYILGNGSNLLVSDSGYPGIVIQLFDRFNGIRTEGSRMYVMAGALLSRTANVAAKNSLSGLEAAAGIPGTLGGAVVMNAGAYGFEIKDVTDYVRVMRPDGSIEEIGGPEMGFGYRTSRCAGEGLIVLGAGLILVPGREDLIRERMRELKEKRSSKQPLEYPSAGSTFKRPEGYFAGKLIMDAGLKGYSVGDAAVSDKHCGFVINKGNATADNVMTLISHIRDRVKAQSGVLLEPEIKLLGF